MPQVGGPDFPFRLIPFSSLSHSSLMAILPVRGELMLTLSLGLSLPPVLVWIWTQGRKCV